MALQANCPSCGAQVLFKTGSSVVVVCEFCRSVVARTDRGIEDAGKVADIAETGSPLDVGLRGVYLGVAFELTGRAQLQHAAGGFWDEWYAAFTDGRWGWLAEAQGRFYLTFEIQVPQPALLPPYEQLQLGQPVYAIPAQSPPVVAEKGTARALAADGEIPYLLTPGETYAYADLSGQSGAFGTLDYGEWPPAVYVGREVSLGELGLAGAQRVRERAARAVTASQLNCPNCAGPLELRAPDAAERVTCPNCGALLDVNQGKLQYLKRLERKGPPPSIPLGSTAEFEGQPQTVIGFMVRSVEFEGVRYYWQEYLLYNPAVGFRWLVESDGHWSYVSAVPPGEVFESGNTANYGGKSFKIFQDAFALVEFVEGEFYWKVSVGEYARATDYVRAPLMLSKEVPVAQSARNAALQSEEVNWSLGTYTPLKEVEQKFNVNLPSPHTVAPNQPWKNGKIYGYWAAFLVVAIFIGILMFISAPRARVFSQVYTLTPQASPTPAPGEDANEKTQVIFTDPLELHGGRNIRVTGSANVNNSWVYVAGDFVDEETGLVQSFDLPIEYYQGVEDGESWSEGDREQTVYLPALPEGRYTMRLEAQWDQAAPPQLTVKVEQGVPRLLNMILLLVGLSIIPILAAIRHWSFERRRWADSAFNPYAASGDGGGNDD